MLIQTVHVNLANFNIAQRIRFWPELDKIGILISRHFVRMIAESIQQRYIVNHQLLNARWQRRIPKVERRVLLNRVAKTRRIESLIAKRFHQPGQSSVRPLVNVFVTHNLTDLILVALSKERRVHLSQIYNSEIRKQDDKNDKFDKLQSNRLKNGPFL